MTLNHFTALGLSPDRYESAEIARRFFARRTELLERLDQPATHHAARRELDHLHVAFLVLRDARAQAAHLAECTGRGGEDRHAGLRRLIAASLEDGLLRCSRRERILAEGRKIGLSDFHTHLLIAQTQFGGSSAVLDTSSDALLAQPQHGDERGDRTAARLAAVAVLALALLLTAVRWLGV